MTLREKLLELNTKYKGIESTQIFACEELLLDNYKSQLEPKGHFDIRYEISQRKDQDIWANLLNSVVNEFDLTNAQKGAKGDFHTVVTENFYMGGAEIVYRIGAEEWLENPEDLEHFMQTEDTYGAIDFDKQNQKAQLYFDCNRGTIRLESDFYQVKELPNTDDNVIIMLEQLINYKH